MLKRFKIKELIFIALIGALMFTIAFSLGVGLIAVTGTPMVGGIIVNLFVAFILVTGLLVVRKFGAATLMVLIHTTLSSPTINMGPPGFYKIILGLILGLFADTILLIGNYKRASYYLASVLGFVILVPFMWLMLNYLGLPGADKLKSLIILLMIIYGLEAAIGTYLARIIYKRKLKNSILVKSIQS